jgi:hypothetical protein
MSQTLPQHELLRLVSLPQKARFQPSAEMGATQERTLYAIGSNALIMIEASSSGYHCGSLALGKATNERGGDPMRFYTKPHQFYCGIDLHARTMYVCIVNRDGEVLPHRNMKAAPEALLKAVAP